MVLGTCFRLLANAKNTDSVTNTAAATVRQACSPYSLESALLACAANSCLIHSFSLLLDMNHPACTRQRHHVSGNTLLSRSGEAILRQEK